jgi:DNA-binding NarL/FixJ family response regulator
MAQSGKVVWLNPRAAATRVFLIEEHEKVRQALAARLRMSPGIILVGQAGEAEKALEEVRKSRPDVVLVEIKRGDGMGLEIVREVASLPWSPRVVVLTTYESSWERTAAKRAGACDYILKQLDSEELVDSIQRLAA